MALLTRDGDVMDKEWGDITAADVLRGALVLHLHQRQRRLAVVVLPPAQRDTGQRVQLHARRRRRIDRFEERADDQPQPLHPVCREERHALPDLPRRDRRPGAQGADWPTTRTSKICRPRGCCRCSTRATSTSRASTSPIGVNGLVEAAEFLGIPINDNDDYVGFVQGVLGLIERYNKKYRSKELHVQLRDDPGRERGRETRQMGSRGRLRRTARLLQLLFLRRRGRIAERRSTSSASTAAVTSTTSRAVRRCT